MNRRSIRDVVVTYVVAATLWIALSDTFAHWLLGEHADMYLVDLAKGVLFVIVTAGVLCVMLQRIERRQADLAKENDQQRRLAQMVFRSTAEGIAVTDANANIVEVNPAFEAITGYTRDEVIGHNPSVLQSGRQDREFYAGMWQALLATGQWRGEVWNRRKSGEIYPEWLTISAVKNGTGATSHYVGVFSDISSVKQAQEQIEFLAHHDALTRLPNRALLLERLQHGLTHARRHGQRLAVMLLDLDRFKNVNDSLGHTVGDELLQEIARRISAQIRADDTLARLGGDELGLLLEDERSITGIEAVARKLLGVLAAPVVIAEHALTVTASIGISVFPGDGEDAGTLLKNADGAMYEAKKKGRNGYAFFAPELAAGALERLVMESALRAAVARNELVLYYQPQVELASGRVVGVEALVRWCHPELGLVPPAQFVPLAEEIGVIGEIGLWVLDEACAQMARWQAQGLAVPRVAVNLSAQQLRNDALVDAVAAALRRHGLQAQQLELELTESMIMEQPELARRVLEGLRMLGVQVAVDDFGTGYSSLAYLKLLELDRLKIDQSFVRDIGTDPNDEAITRAVIALANSLGLETVAEGVEHDSQVDFLRAEGCDAAQGYHFGRPLPAEEVVAVLSSSGPVHGQEGKPDAA